MQINGEIHSIKSTQQVSDNFSKREFILITDQLTPYPQHIKFEFTQSKCNLLDNYNDGDKVSVDFNLRGNLHKDTAFVTLQAWKIEKV